MEDGTPVAGVGLKLQRAEVDVETLPQEEAGTPFSGYLIRRPQDGGIVSAATSGPDGRLEIHGLPAGRYFARWDLRGGPYLLPAIAEVLFISVPGPEKMVVVREPWASVVEFRGDACLFSGDLSANDWPFEMISDPDNETSMRMVTSRLSRRFPGCHVVAGLPRGNKRVRSAFSIPVFGATGGWSTHSLALRPISTIDRPDIVDLVFGAADQSAKLRVSVGDPGNVLEASSVSVVWEAAKPSCFASVVVGSEVAVPSGVVTVFPGPGMPRDAFEPMKTRLVPGANAVMVPIKGNYVRYHVQVKAGGLQPGTAGVVVDGSGIGCSTSFLTAPGGNASFVSKGESNGVTAFVAGYEPVSVVVDRNLIADAQGVRHVVLVVDKVVQ